MKYDINKFRFIKFHVLILPPPIFFATSPKASDGVWKDSPSCHSKVKLPASVVAMVIRGIIINCTTNGIGRLYADFQIAWDMYKAISRWNAPLN